MIQDPKAKIIDVQSWNDYRLFSLESPAIARTASPGQFLMVKVSEGPYPLLRRPFGIHAREAGRVDIFFQVAGKGTDILSRRCSAETIDILGPLGKGFTLDPRLKDKDVFCVGGGRGIAPIFFLSQELRALGARPVVFYGGRTKADLPIRGRFEAAGHEVLCSTDDGSFGYNGFVSRLVEEELQRRRPEFLFSCGPDPMMRAVAALTRKRGIPSEFSLESIMGCGIGACWGCVQRIRREGHEGWLKICEDGPVFPEREIVWTESDR